MGRRTAAAAMTALMSLASPALGVEYTARVAISPDVVLGSGIDGSCPGGASRIGVSHDRGATWTAAGCAALTLWTADPAPAGAVTTRGGEVVRVLPDGAVTALTGGEAVSASSAAASADDGVEAYATGYPRGSNTLHAFRYATGAGWQRCPSDPPWSAGDADGGLLRSGGLLATMTQAAAEGDQVRLWTSTDRCATWTDALLPAGVRVTEIDAAGRIHAHRTVGAEAQRVMSLDRGATWVDGDWLATRGMWPEDASLRRYRRVGLSDAAERVAYPQGWRPLTVAGPADAPAPLTPAFEYINSRYRTPMGLLPLRHDAALSRAAAGHVAYWTLSGAGAGLSAHEETPGSPGFTGAGPSERCLAAGAALGCGEVAFPGVPDLLAATRGWLATPYHGTPLLDSGTAGFAAGTTGSVGNMSGNAVQERLDLDAPPNTRASALHIWPADGMTEVPLRWWGGETPDPLQDYTGDRADVGPVLFVRTPALNATLTLTGPAGPIALLRPGATVATAVGVVADGEETATFLPAQALAAGAAYTLRVDSPWWGSVTTRFTTATSGDGGGGTGDDGTPAVTTPAARRTARVTVAWPRGDWRRWRPRVVTARVVSVVGTPTGTCRAELRTGRGRWSPLATAGLRAGTCRLRVALNGRSRTLRVRYAGSALHLPAASATRAVRVR